ncbi:MAG: bifunctional adenosylcobinamide kinase/adenosylcobinamide-phosphate guanylyltransferase [Magnetococcales bacterium]|nr:bifunctional adenosylcobinamide kinase/adenosylcobinamide-phosphate guanylyltransferase [Magnetococcales bacterium]
MLELILGGARSGKSRLAEEKARLSALEVTYVATGQARDEEMAQRIALHKKNRPGHWGLVEEPLFLADALKHNQQEGRLLLVDCLTLWLSNHLLDGSGYQRWQQEKRALLDFLPHGISPTILVSNETGLGVVPMGELNRLFVDEAGWLHQDLASLSDRVTLTVAGLPLVLKGE